MAVVSEYRHEECYELPALLFLFGKNNKTEIGNNRGNNNDRECA
jgi:hypothetical protein